MLYVITDIRGSSKVISRNRHHSVCWMIWYKKVASNVEIKHMIENFCYLLHWVLSLFTTLALDSMIKQDRRWNAEQPSATLDP